MSIPAKTLVEQKDATIKADVIIGSHRVLYFFFKRSFDIIFALVGSLAVIPLAILIKIGNLLTGDFAPLFYTTTRIGKHGRAFKIIKFRSMIVTKNGKSAEELLGETLAREPKLRRQWQKYRKLDPDPRITKVGRFIRGASLDEFPQFINVLKGDMSLIGPRPLMPGELEDYNGDGAKYNSLRPGLTGWWAANGRSQVDYSKRLELEYWYVDHASIATDIRCILRTVKTVFLGRGGK